jgi:cold shock CspA family protein
MARRAVDWATSGEQGEAFNGVPPVVMPAQAIPITRKVGVVKWYSRPKAFGYIVAFGEPCDAFFELEDVAPGDRARLDSGQTVTFEVAFGPDGNSARQIRIDTTTLPPPPNDDLVLKGWR